MIPGYIFLLASSVVLMVPVQMAADDAECGAPPILTCFICDSRKDSFCEDPFNSTELSLTHTKKCEGECLKWEREIDPGNPDSEWYILRMCKSEVMVEMYLSPDMCIGESRPGSGHMCTCMAERCNHATAISAPNYILLVYTALMGLLLHYSNHHLLGLS